MVAPLTSNTPPIWQVRTGVGQEQITDFCRKWRVIEFAIFGSLLRDDFRPDSDADILVTFDPAAQWDLFDLIDMREELERMFSRAVDLVEKKALRNPFRRHHILGNHQVIYAA